MKSKLRESGIDVFVLFLFSCFNFLTIDVFYREYCYIKTLSNVMGDIITVQYGDVSLLF